MGKKLHERFESFRKKYPIVGEIRGLGAMLGITLVKGDRREPAADEAKKLAAFCLERGLIILVCGTYSNVIRVLAPFVITDDAAREGAGDHGGGPGGALQAASTIIGL